MSFFDDDPFESIMKEFFGEDPRAKNYKESFMENEEDERIIDYVETDKNVFLIFELPGYSKEDIIIKIIGKEIEISAKKKNFENVQGYLSQKLRSGFRIKKILPKIADQKKFNYTFKNGILEVMFEKK